MSLIFSKQLNEAELNLLDKGSFFPVPPVPPAVSDTEALVLRAEINVSLERALLLNLQLSNAIQLRGDLHRIMKDTILSTGVRDGSVSKTIRVLKAKDIVIMPNDKFERFIALN